MAYIFEVTTPTFPHDEHKTLCPHCWEKKKKIHKGINKQAKENSHLPFNYRKVIAMLIIISIKVKSFHHSGMNI